MAQLHAEWPGAICQMLPRPKSQGARCCHRNNSKPNLPATNRRDPITPLALHTRPQPRSQAAPSHKALAKSSNAAGEGRLGTIPSARANSHQRFHALKCLDKVESSCPVYNHTNKLQLLNPLHKQIQCMQAVTWTSNYYSPPQVICLPNLEVGMSSCKSKIYSLQRKPQSNKP